MNFGINITSVSVLVLSPKASCHDTWLLVLLAETARSDSASLKKRCRHTGSRAHCNKQSAPVRLWTAHWIDIFIPLIILVQGFHSVKINFNAIKEKSISDEAANSSSLRHICCLWQKGVSLDSKQKQQTPAYWGMFAAFGQNEFLRSHGSGSKIPLPQACLRPLSKHASSGQRQLSQIQNST